MKIIMIVIIILALAGVVDSAYALNQHYATADTSSCDFNETVSCTAVNQSSYSEAAGIPVAGIGIAGYILMASLSGLLLVRQERAGVFLPLAVLVSLGALTVSLVLTYIEVFILKAVCPLCVASLALVVAITALFIAAAGKRFISSRS